MLNYIITLNNLNIPFDRIVKFGQQTMMSEPLFAVSWILGRFCNYKCSYCWPYARSDSLDFQEYNIYTRTVDNIKQQSRENGFTKFHWSFSGGEPTTYKQLLELARYVGDDSNTEYQSLHMTTNLSPGTKWWDNFSKVTSNFSRRSITASFHGEFAKELEFAEKCQLLTSQQVFVTVNQVMVPSNFYELYDRCQRLSNLGINVTLKPQSDPTASKVVDGYTEEMINLMKTGFPQQVNGEEIYQVVLYDDTGQEYFFDQAERFNAFGFNKFKGWNCNSGYQSVIIRGNEVKRSYSCHDAPLGTLTEGFKLFNNPVMCTTNSCVSSADSKIPKCK